MARVPSDAPTPMQGSAPNPRLIAVNGALKQQSERLATLSARAAGLRTRLVGDSPAVQPETPNPQSDGIVGQIESSLCDVGYNLDYLDDILSQLEGVC
jgi:hypothetical protein